MNKLQQQIVEASQKYYESGTSGLTDEQFDRLLDQLKEQDPSDPLLTNVGHGYDIELDTTFGDKVKHLYGPAKSLPKCHDFKEYSSQLNSDTVYASLKLDGMSVVLYYVDGKLTLALTRGSGEGDIGIDITNKLQYVSKDVLKLPDDKFTGAVRGELVMSYSNFNIYQEIYDSDASNPRNTAVGLVKSKEFDKDAVSLVDIVVYNVVGIDVEKMPHRVHTFEKYSGAIEWLIQNFPVVVPYSYITCNAGMFNHTMQSLRKRWYGVYPADGIVITADQGVVTQFDNSKHRVAWDAVAYKFPPETKQTEVTGVEWKLGRTKNLIPRVSFKSIDLAGTMVSWAHGDNAKNIIDNQICKGAIVEVSKRGEIIPHIEKVISSPQTVDIPHSCPACSSELVWIGMHLHCPNVDCSDFEIQDALVWCSYIAPFDGLGDILKLKFFSQCLSGLSNLSVESIYSIEPPVAVEGSSIQYSNFCKMYDMLYHRKVDLGTALKALNIPRIGDITGDKLARFPNLVRQLMEGQCTSIDEDLRKQIGNANCDSILLHQWKFARLKFIEDNIDWDPVSTEIKGTVVITGKLSVKRDVFEAELKAYGYATSGSVNKNTFCLITDSPDSGTSKNAQADKFGIPKLSESEFRTQYM